MMPSLYLYLYFVSSQASIATFPVYVLRDESTRECCTPRDTVGPKTTSAVICIILGKNIGGQEKAPLMLSHHMSTPHQTNIFDDRPSFPKDIKAVETGDRLFELTVHRCSTLMWVEIYSKLPVSPQLSLICSLSLFLFLFLKKKKTYIKEKVVSITPARFSRRGTFYDRLNDVYNLRQSKMKSLGALAQGELSVFHNCGDCNRKETLEQVRPRQNAEANQGFWYPLFRGVLVF